MLTELSMILLLSHQVRSSGNNEITLNDRLEKLLF